MSNRYYTHLHLHTDYSLLDGAIRIEQLIAFGKEHNIPSLAISDHGNIFGAVKFFQACKKAGIKPVLGMEAYLTENAGVKRADNKYYHLLLLVQNEKGYKNLCKLIEFSYTKGFYFKPRIDYAVLQEYSEGLIATTTCLGGHVPQLILQKQYDNAVGQIDWFLKTFGEDRFYLEVQPLAHEEQYLVNEFLFSYAQEKGIPLIATADSHYPSQEDKFAHEVMLAIQTRHKMSDPGRMSLAEFDIHMRTPQEMLDAFPNHQDAVWRTGEIADKCNFDFPSNQLHFPIFKVPEGTTQEEYFRRLCVEGLEKLFAANRIDTQENTAQAYWERLEEEMNLIIKMGFVTYFLIVSDFIQWAKRNDIPVGPGRGSAAGSLVAWALSITDIDPIKYKLLFERFLNPERITMPDVDIDFCIEGRERVIQYVRDRYGHDHVCQIITFGTMLAKGVVKDVARALGVPFEDANALTDLIPDQLKITLEEAFEQEPKLGKLCEENPRIKQVFDIARKLEGITRHASKHAAGIVITPEPVSNLLPIYVPSKTDDIVAQYAMTELESIGFLKMDFLGLKNLTLIDQVIKLIEKNHGIRIDVGALQFDDKKTYELLARGDTTGVFQFESSGIRDVLRRLQPEVFEDIIATNALYRPGPLGSGMVDDFIERKHGRQKITYIFPELETILKPTYGTIVYQEQVMQIPAVIANYSLGEADILRRAMGKKKADVMAQQKEIFVSRAKKNGFDEQKAAELFDLMAYFAGYGFNKSHSAAYGFIAYQTAYLKAHYPAEFMACLISLEAGDPEKMASYIQETREMGIPVLPPNINKSLVSFDTDGKSILFGLQGIKNVGMAALSNCLEERRKRGPFKDILDFCVRIDLRTCNKRVIESLICSGAFDELPGSRSEKMHDLQNIIDEATAIKKERETGQMNLFALTNGSHDSTETPPHIFSSCKPWSATEILEKEKEVLGLYLSAEPLDEYKDLISWLQAKRLQDVLQEETSEKETPVSVCAIARSVKQIMTKKGQRMGFLAVEDHVSHAEVVLFPKVFERVSHFLDSTSPLFIKGKKSKEGTTIKIIADLLFPLTDIWENPVAIKQMICTVPDTWKKDDFAVIKNYCQPGPTHMVFIIPNGQATYRVTSKNPVLCSRELLTFIHQQGAQIALELL